jgi:hypothetical protein
MSPAQEQFARMKRYLLRMEKKGATDEDTDDLYSFFLHAWHLIDWASHDPALGTDPELARKKLLADITKAISGCKDIANRTKHLELTKPPRQAPEITTKNISVGLVSKPQDRRPAVATYIFTLPDGSPREALEFAHEVAQDWERLLKGYGIAL